MNPALRSSAAHVFVESLEAPELEPDDEHHLLRVLRLRDGQLVSVSDGAGSWRLTAVAGRRLQPTGPVERSSQLAPALVIAAAIPKGDRVEWMVQKLTEIGVRGVTFLHCARSVVRWEGERGERQLQRATRVAREAAMQSRRVWLPELSGPAALGSVAGRPNAVLAEPSGIPPSALGIRPSVVVIGPEGGFSPDEVAVGAPLVSLGDTVLRVETAALVAAVKFLM